MGTIGNKRAHELAKEVTKKNEVNLYLYKSNKKLRKELEKQKLVYWQERWTNATKGTKVER